jgi:hypothetical protein
VLYLLLAFLALRLAFDHSGQQVDSRGALHTVAGGTVGTLLIVLLAIGFAMFALWHAYVAITNPNDRETHERLADAVRAVMYGALTLLALSFVVNSGSNRNSDQTSKTWTAHVLSWPAGRILVGGFGVTLIIAAVALAWRVLAQDKIDSTAVLDAAPRDDGIVHPMGVAGNLARALVVALIGWFFLDAAIHYNANDAVGLDGALRTTLNGSLGKFLVVVVAIGFATFGLYSIMRALVNRSVSAGRVGAAARRRAGGWSGSGS